MTGTGQQLEDPFRGEWREQDAVAEVAGGDQQARHRRLTDDRTVVGRAGAEPGRRLEQLVLVDDGHDPACGVEQLDHRAGLHGQIEALLLDGRAHDEGAVGPRDQVARPTVDEAAHGRDGAAGRRRRRAGG